MVKNALDIYYERDLVKESVEVVCKLESRKIGLKMLEQKARKETITKE